MDQRCTVRRADFWLLCIGQLVSQFGDSLFHIGLLWLALDRTGSKMQTGFIATAGYLPAILLSLFAGVVADRLDRRRLMIACAGLQALVVGAVPLLDGWGWLSAPALAGVAFGLAAGAAFFNPARDALVPHLVPPARLNQSNALVQLSAQLAYMAGPAAAGALLGLVGVVHLFSLDSATFVFSLLTLLAIRAPRPRPAPLAPAPAPLPQVPPAAGTLTEVREGLQLAWSDRILRGLLLLTAVDNLFIMGPAIVGLPIYVREHLGLGGDGGTAYALITASFFCGMVLMSLALSLWGRAWPKGRLILLGMSLDGLTFVPFTFLQRFDLACLAMFVHGLTVPLLTVPRTTLVQQQVADHQRGRIFALLNLAVVGCTALSSAFTGLATEWIPVAWLYGGIGALGAACGAAGFLLLPALREAR